MNSYRPDQYTVSFTGEPNEIRELAAKLVPQYRTRAKTGIDTKYGHVCISKTGICITGVYTSQTRHLGVLLGTQNVPSWWAQKRENVTRKYTGNRISDKKIWKARESGKTLAEVGQMFGFSGQWVTRRLNKLMCRVRIWARHQNITVGKKPAKEVVEKFLKEGK